MNASGSSAMLSSLAMESEERLIPGTSAISTADPRQRPEFLHEYDLDSLLLVRPQTRPFSMYVTPRYREHYEEFPFEEYSANLVHTLLSRATLFIDVGAHYGFYTLLAGKTNPRLEIIACEPTPETCQVLARNVVLNELKNVMVRQIALSDQDGALPFNVSLASDSCGFHPNPVAPPLGQLAVTTRRLDSLLAGRVPGPVLIKIDTEGHEVAVLRGLSGALERFPELQLLVEFNPLMQHAAGYGEEALLSQLEGMGFAVFVVEEKARRVIRVESQQQLSKAVEAAGYGNIYCARLGALAQPSRRDKWCKHAIDTPQSWKLKSRNLTLQGWCFGRQGLLVQGVRARRDHHVWEGRYGSVRQDVARVFPENPLALHSAFEIRVTAPIIPGRLLLEAEDQFGRWHTFHSRFVSRWRGWVRPEPPPPPPPKPRRLQAAEGMPKVLESLRSTHCVLAVSHSDYRVAVGGTQKLLQQEEALLGGRGISYLEIHPATEPSAPGEAPGDFLMGLYADGRLVGLFDAGQLRQLFQALAQAEVSFEAIHLHHLMGFDLELLSGVLESLPAPRRFFIHDFYSTCPQWNLLKNDAEFCNGPPAGSTVCSQCTYGIRRPAHWGAFRSFFERWRPEFVAPSALAGEAWGASFPNLAAQVRVVPHLVEPSTVSRPVSRVPGSRLRLAYVGYKHPYKGWEEWKRLVSELPRDHYELFVLGSCDEFMTQVEYVPVSFVQNGPEAMTRALQEYAIDLAFLWSLVPETYSFTLFESLAAGCYVLTSPRSGNIAAQVRQYGRGRVARDFEELLAFLRDARGVKACLEQFQRRHWPFSLAPNPALAEEVAARLSSRQEVPSPLGPAAPARAQEEPAPLCWEI